DDPIPHLGEHSVEVNLPFVQTVFPDAKVSSILISNVDEELCQTIGRRIADAVLSFPEKQILIVVSSDMCHYPRYETANQYDGAMLKAIETLSSDQMLHELSAYKNSGEPNLHCVMCGGAAMLTAIEAAKALGANEAKTLFYQNSGDSEWGDHDRVVGYGSLAIYWPEVINKPIGSHELNLKEKQELLTLARCGIEAELKGDEFNPSSESAGLQRKAGLFVTLKNRGDLRGCLGRFEPVEWPLYRLVPHMAAQTAVHDHRFTSLSEDELSWTDIQISVLSPLRPIDDVNEIRIGRDGLQIEGMTAGGYQSSGTLLPQVASERNWSVEEFLEALCIKAQLEPGAWRSTDTKLWAYSADVFGDLDFQSPPFRVESQSL
ncbi:AmmeMemoRadiSam system protein A, partial [bacterium]|nr:AmmeMemoRadiSam system protein A [bacterium]